MRELKGLKDIVMENLYISIIKGVIMQCEGWECPCDRQDAERIRMNTAYCDEEKNFRILCPECKKECDAFWEEEWRRFYIL